VKIALLSLDASLAIEQRMKEIEKLIAKSAKNGVRLALLPELSYSGYTNDSSILASNNFDSALKFFSYLARRHRIYIGFGAPTQNGRKFKNSYTVVSDSGDAVCEYQKIHTFSFAEEDAVFERGDSIASFSVDGVSIGVSICYDLRFAEIFSLYADGCDAVVCPSAWPKNRIKDFRLLIKARALENRLSVIGINWRGGGLYLKSSCVSNEAGVMQKPLISGSRLDIYELAKKNIAKNEPNSVLDKRFDLYAKLMMEHK
jgi:predicted amidohydrolase